MQKLNIVNLTEKIKKLSRSQAVALSVAVLVGAVGVYLLASSSAATNAVAIEAEAGTLSGNTAAGTTAGASGNAAVKFAAGGGNPNPNPPNPNPNPAQYPADITGPEWKVTLPKVSGGKVVEIKPPDYMTYSDEFFSLNSAKNGVVFKVWHGGGTTQNSSNPRSELRERVGDDPEGYWDASSGRHTMTLRGKVNRLTKVKPHTVIAQIHGGDDDVTVFRVEGNTLWLSDGDNAHGFKVTDNFKLNEEYEIGFDVNNGTVSYKYNGQTIGHTLSSNDSSCYFKAGAYLQSNPSSAPDESEDEYTEVEIFEISVDHS